MAGFRMDGQRGNLAGTLNPGDTVFTSDQPQVLTATTAQSIPAALMVGGYLYRTGPVGAVTDTMDSPANILLALGGTLGPDIVPRMGFKFRYMNGSTQTLTVFGSLGVGYDVGVNNTNNQYAVATLTWIDLLLQFTSTQVPFSALCSTVSGSNIVNFVLPQGQASIPMGAVPGGINLMTGAGVLTAGGTPVASGTKVTGVIQGPGGITGFTMSANAIATAAASLSFQPTIALSSLGSGTLP